MITRPLVGRQGTELYRGLPHGGESEPWAANFLCEGNNLPVLSYVFLHIDRASL